MLSNQRETFKPFVNFIAKKLTWIHPNILTLIGLTISIIIFLLISNKHYLHALLIGLLLAFDALDGAVARITNQASKFGTFLDSVTDRVADCLLILGFAVANLVNTPLVIAVILTSFTISYMRAVIESVQKNRIILPKGLMQRTERIALLGVGLLLAIIFPNSISNQINPTEMIFLTILLGNCYTICQRFYEAYTTLK